MYEIVFIHFLAIPVEYDYPQTVNYRQDFSIEIDGHCSNSQYMILDCSKEMRERPEKQKV